MRKIEEIGQKYKRSGFFKGTEIMKYAKLITGCAVVIGLAVELLIVKYKYDKDQRKIKEGKVKKEEPIVKDAIETRLQELLQRREVLFPEKVPKGGDPFKLK